MAAGQQGAVERALAHYAESLALFRAAGDRWHVAWLLTYQAHLMVKSGDIAGARRSAAEGLALHRTTNDPWGVGVALSALGRIAHADRDLNAATAHFVEGLRLLVEGGVTRAIPGLLEDLAGVALTWGQVDRAARLGGAAEALGEAAGVVRITADWTTGTVDLSELRSGPRTAAWAEGRALPLEGALAEVNALVEETARSGVGRMSESALLAQ
jgi:hypothetical protein